MASAVAAVDGGGEIQPAAAEALSHPEEIEATVDLRVGDRVHLNATARTKRSGQMTVAFVVRDGGSPHDWRYV